MRLIRENVEREAADQAAIARLKKQGFKEVFGEKHVSDASGETSNTGKCGPDLASMKADELKELAKEKGIAGAASLTKAELLEALKDVV